MRVNRPTKRPGRTQSLLFSAFDLHSNLPTALVQGHTSCQGISGTGGDGGSPPPSLSSYLSLDLPLPPREVLFSPSPSSLFLESQAPGRPTGRPVGYRACMISSGCELPRASFVCVYYVSVCLCHELLVYVAVLLGRMACLKQFKPTVLSEDSFS